MSCHLAICCIRRYPSVSCSHVEKSWWDQFSHQEVQWAERGQRKSSDFHTQDSGVESAWSWVYTDLSSSSALLLVSCVSSEKSPDLSEPHFLHQQNDDENPLLWGLDETGPVQSLMVCASHSVSFSTPWRGPTCLSNNFLLLQGELCMVESRLHTRTSKDSSKLWAEDWLKRLLATMAGAHAVQKTAFEPNNTAYVNRQRKTNYWLTFYKLTAWETGRCFWGKRAFQESCM